MVRIMSKLPGNTFQEFLLHLEHSLSPSYSCAVGDPEYVSVHSDGRLAKRRIQHYVCGLPAHPGQPFQFLPGARNLSAMILNE